MIFKDCVKWGQLCTYQLILYQVYMEPSALGNEPLIQPGILDFFLGHQLKLDAVVVTVKDSFQGGHSDRTCSRSLLFLGHGLNACPPLSSRTEAWEGCRLEGHLLRWDWSHRMSLWQSRRCVKSWRSSCWSHPQRLKIHNTNVNHDSITAI